MALGPADRERLYELWRVLLNDLIGRMNDGTAPLRASTLEVVRAFLKDNGVDVRSIADYRAGLRQLADELKDIDQAFDA